MTAEVDSTTGQIDFDDNGAGGTTRVVGIYIDPLVTSGDVVQYATSTAGLNYLSGAGLLNNCNETSSACQAKTMTREEAAAVVTVIGGISLDAPNAYSDDDQSIFQKAINGIPYFGIQVCIGGGTQFQPTETISRDQFACLLVKAITAGSTTNLSGSIDKYSDEGASNWTNEINVLAANDIIPACSSLQDKFCPSRKISIGEVSYIVDKLVSKSLISTNLFNASPFNNSWEPAGGEVANVAETAVSNPNAGNDACVGKDNSSVTINSVLDVQQYLANNGFNPGPVDGQSGPKTKAAIKAFQEKNSLYADGVVGPKTKAAMKAYTGCESGNVCKARDNSNASLNSVSGIQTFLANNGFNPGIIDGEMGSYTREAIKAFQRKVGLIPDGEAGTRTKSAMKSYTGC